MEHMGHTVHTWGKTYMPRRRYITGEPEEIASNVPREKAKAEFATRLKRLMDDKGIIAAELTRRVKDHLPDNVRFGNDTISNYVRGLAFPNDIRLNAICKVLGVKKEELVPTTGFTNVRSNVEKMSVRQLEDGNVWLHINQAVPMKTALKVMAALEEIKD